MCVNGIRANFIVDIRLVQEKYIVICIEKFLCELTLTCIA